MRIYERVCRLVQGAVVIRSKAPRGLASSTAQVETSSHAQAPFRHEGENSGDGVVMDAGPQSIWARREGGLDGPEKATARP